MILHVTHDLRVLEVYGLIRNDVSNNTFAFERFLLLNECLWAMSLCEFNKRNMMISDIRYNF